MMNMWRLWCSKDEGVVRIQVSEDEGVIMEGCLTWPPHWSKLSSGLAKEAHSNENNMFIKFSTHASVCQSLVPSELDVQHHHSSSGH